MSALSAQSYNHNGSFPATLRKVYEVVRNQLSSSQPHAEQLVTLDGMQFLCVWTGLKDSFDPGKFRASMASLLGLGAFNMIQVVGDSGSELSTITRSHAREVIEACMKKASDGGQTTVLEYGYTASKHDVNWIVDDLISSNPEVGSRTVANVVYQSAKAVDEWGCSSTGNVTHFVLAYDIGETAFGSDVWLSDSVMVGNGQDVLVCVEGGPQSFGQAVSLCVKGVQIIAITHPVSRVKPLESSPCRFSAAYTLALLRGTLDDFDGRKILTEQEKAEIENRAIEYLDNCHDLTGASNQSKYTSARACLKALMMNVQSLWPVQIVHLQ